MPLKQITVGISSLILIGSLGFWIAKNTQKSSQSSNSSSVAGIQDGKVAKASEGIEPTTTKPELYVPELETTSTPNQPIVSSDFVAQGNSFDQTAKTPLQFTPQNSITRTTVPTTTPPAVAEKKLSEEPDQRDKDSVKIIHTPETVIPAPQPGEDLQKTITFGLENKKISSNIDSNLATVPTNQVLQFTFEQPVTEKFASFLKFTPPLEFNRIINGNTLTIAPIEPLAKSSVYTFGVNRGSLCAFDSETCQLPDSTNFKITFTTNFNESFSYGKSVDGRDLIAYKFGQCKDANCTKVMLTGGIHGSEWRSGDLTSFKNWLLNNPQEIVGKNKELLIIPFTNPDGFAKNQRLNSNNVNLNRNFATGWQACDECGTAPESEPETKALVKITNSFKPKFLISYHAQWPTNGIIFRGDDNNTATQTFAQWVSDRSGYPVGVFPEQTAAVPGDQVVWGETIGARGIVIESTNINSTDWDKNINVYMSLLREKY
jgi:hypothetical protein